MRILHVANFGELKYGEYYYNTDHKISLGLIRNGHYVYNFSYRDITRCESWLKSTRFNTNIPNSKLLKVCKNLDPHLLLLGHSETITAETLARIRAEYPSIKLAMWYVDALFVQGKADYILDRLPFLDAFFVTTAGPLADRFTTQNCITSFFPNIVDSSVESEKAFSRESFDCDILYCGRDAGNSERQQLLIDLKSQLPDDVKICFRGCLGNAPVHGREYLSLLSASSMGLNLNRRNDTELYSSDRIAQLTGNGLLTFCPAIPGFKKLYTDDEIIYFDTTTDLTDKIRYYKNNQKDLRRIARNGWEKAHSKYNSQRVTQFMVEVIFRTCNQDFFQYSH